jgi:hypothetical protein
MDVQAFTGSGGDVPGWPKLTGDWMVANPAIGSFGTLDDDAGAKKVVIAATRAGRIQAFSTPAAACSPSSWPQFHHDRANSGDLRRDATPPGRPTDLAFDGRALTFDAPGDDLLCGTAKAFEVRTSARPITAATFGAAEAVAAEGAPRAAGEGASLPVAAGMLRRYVAVRAVDEQGNVGRTVALDRGCAPTAGLRSVGVRPRRRGARISFARAVRRPVTVDVFQQGRGRRVIGERLVARFRNRARSFNWSGRANRRGRRVRDGFYVVRFRIRDARGRIQSRRVAVRRLRGRFRRRPGIERGAECRLLRTFRLERPVFGGRRNRAVGVSFRLSAAARVDVRLMRRGRTVRRLMAGQRAGNRTHRLRVASERRRRGDYRIRIEVRRGRERVAATIVARRL